MPNPDFTIVIPTFNRPELLGRCLEAISGLQTEPADFEVIVIDDHSEQAVQAVVSGFEEQLNLTYEYQAVNRGPAAARNRGAELASGRYLCFTDDDCMPHPEWLNALRGHFDENCDSMLGGSTVNSLSENPYSEASQLLLDYLYGHLLTDSGEPVFFTSNNMAMATSAFRAIGGFDASIRRAASEDREICHRFRKSGRSLVHVPDALVYHAHEMDFRAYCRQHFWYGWGALQFRRLLKAKEHSSPPVEPLGFYSGMLGFPFSRMGPLQACGCAGLLALSQVVHTAGFAWHVLQRS